VSGSQPPLRPFRFFLVQRPVSAIQPDREVR